MTTITQEAAMQDDVIKVREAMAAVFRDADGADKLMDVRDRLARAAMATTREIDAEALRELANSRPYVSENENMRREESINITADWLQQRAKDVRAIGAP
jgi:hypothetical protein